MSEASNHTPTELEKSKQIFEAKINCISDQSYGEDKINKILQSTDTGFKDTCLTRCSTA